MFPRKCSQPPCRNIDEITVDHAKAAGTMPHSRMNPWRSAPGSISSNRKARAFRTMMTIVTTGVVRDGITSRRGIMLAVYN